MSERDVMTLELVRAPDTLIVRTWPVGTDPGARTNLPVDRHYVAVDALRKALWQRVVSGDEHHDDMTRMLGYIDAFALTLRTDKP